MVIDWSAVALAVVVASVLGGRSWIAKAVGSQIKADLRNEFQPQWQKDIAETVRTIVEQTVSEVVQAKLDNGSNLRRVLDEFRQETLDRLSRMELRQDDLGRQLENVITEELPQITVLAQRVLDDQGETS